MQAVIVFFKRESHAQSENRITTASHFFPASSNRSMQRLFIGNSAADGAGPLTGVLACDAENF